MLPEINHIQADTSVIVPVHEQACAQRNARHITDGRGPITKRWYQQHTDHDINYRRKNVDEATSFVAVLRTLNFNACILGERNHHRQDHNQAQPICIRIRVASPNMHKISSEHNKPAEQVPEDNHLITTHTCHQLGQNCIVIRFSDYTVDLGSKYV